MGWRGEVYNILNRSHKCGYYWKIANYHTSCWDGISLKEQVLQVSTEKVNQYKLHQRPVWSDSRIWKKVFNQLKNLKFSEKNAIEKLQRKQRSSFKKIIGFLVAGKYLAQRKGKHKWHKLKWDISKTRILCCVVSARRIFSSFRPIV